MSDGKFAEGPWTIVPYGDGDNLVIHSDDENRVCFMATHGGSRKSWEQIQANAALIAASPEIAIEGAFLLARLEDFERNHVNGLDGEREEAYRDWAGHVAPSIARLRMIIARANPGEKT